MKLLVHTATMTARPGRLASAIAGLAARGHDVRRLGEAPVPTLRVLGEWRPDAILGAGPIAPLAWTGRRAHAGTLLLERTAADFTRDSLLDAIAWAAQPAFAIVDERDSEGVRAAAQRVPLERVVLWSDAAAAESPGPGDPTHPDVDVLERALERLLAQHTGRTGRPAVFADRDGTLIVEEGYLSEPERVRLVPGVARALRQLREAGIPVVVISNQAGVGRGRFPLERVHATMAQLRRLLRAEGVELDAVRFCPHEPGAGCACRKPGTLLLEQAAEDLRISLPSSVMVGDKQLDVETGHAMGGMGLLVRTGYGREQETLPGRAPDAAFDDFAAAAAWILERYESR